MWKCYLIALIPCLIGAYLSIKSKKVHWIEWLGGSACAFIVAGIFHVCSVKGMTHDIETLSGRVSSGVHRAAWRERYKEAVYKTVTKTSGVGKNRRTYTERVFSHYETRYCNHPDTYTLNCTVGSPISVSRDFYYETVKLFGELKTVRGDRTTFKTGSTMVSGDPNDYHTSPVSGYLMPVTATHSFENRVKAAPSVFSFRKLTEKEAALVYDWPENDNRLKSSRVLGSAANKISTLEWDRMNARLGPVKGVNVIIIGFAGDSSIADIQEAKWIGGKKNDVVICYGADWARVFGWTESAMCKRSLESIVLESAKDDSIIPKIEAEIFKTYVLKDWSKFDYISVEPPSWAYIVLIVVMGATQVGLYVFFHKNDLDATGHNPYYR